MRRLNLYFSSRTDLGERSASIDQKKRRVRLKSGIYGGGRWGRFVGEVDGSLDVHDDSVPVNHVESIHGAGAVQFLPVVERDRALYTVLPES